jgi:hypothetical protein
MIATGSAPVRSSPGRKSRPMTGRAPSTSNSSVEVASAGMRRVGASPSRIVMSFSRYSATWRNPGKLPRRNEYSRSFQLRSNQKRPTSFALAYGSGSNITGRARPNTAAVPPIPSASVSTVRSV